MGGLNTWLRAVVGLGAILVSVPAAAQETGGAVVVLGSVKDLTAQVPIPQAHVRLFRPPADDSVFTELAAETVSEADGSFGTAGLSVGNYRIEVRALGFQTLDREMRVDGASPMEVEVQMAPDAVELEAIIVVSRRSQILESNGFYNRRAQGLGSTFTRAEIEATGYRRVTDVIRNARGLTLRRISPETVEAALEPVSHPHVFMRAGGSACRPDVVLDGVNLGSDLAIDDLVSATDLEAIEVHRTTSIPLQFRQNHCGAVVLWTRDSHMGEPTRASSARRWAAAGGFVLLTLILAR